MSLFWRQLSGELRKLFARKRTFIGFGAFLAFELAFLFFLRLPKVKANLSAAIDHIGYDPAVYMSGLTLGFLIATLTILMLGGLFLALVGGDVVSKEVEDGSLRMILCRPISRGRILFLKVVVILVYTFALTAFVIITALMAGHLNSGIGGLFAANPWEGVLAFHDFWPGLARFLAAIPLLSLSLSSVTMIAFCFSCCNMKPSAATVLTLSILFADMILRQVPYFESIKPYFLTARMATWIHVFEYRIPWEGMVENYAWLLAMDVTLFFIGWAIFESRDFKS